MKKANNIVLTQERDVKMGNSNSRSIQSVSRAILILKCFENNEELGVTDISKMMGLHKSTTFNLISTLEDYQLLEKNINTSKYRLGFELFRLGTKVKGNLRSISTPYLEKLVSMYEETVNLVVRDDCSVLYLEKIESPHSMRISTKVGVRLPLYCTAVGKAILANLSKDEINSILNKTDLKKYTANTICDTKKLLQNLEQAQENGYAEEFEELEKGLICVAGPIFNHTGKVFAAISISGPTSRMNREFRQKISKTVIQFTREISWKMGYKYK